MINSTQLLKIFKASPLPSLLLLPDITGFIILEASTSFFKATGTTAPDLLGRDVFEVISNSLIDKDSHTIADIRSSLLTVMNTRTIHKIDIQKYDILIKGTDKTNKRYWELENTPILSDSGEVEFIIHTINDVTSILLKQQINHPPEEELIATVAKEVAEKKRLEDLLNKANKLARTGSWEIDLINGTVFWSDITKEIRETTPDFVPNLSIGISHFKEGEHRDTIIKRVYECIQHGTPWDEELQLYTYKGKLKWIRTIGEAEFVDGKCIRVYGSFQDIDVRKTAEMKVLELYEEKNTILESIADAFFAADKNWVITYWNKEAEKILNRPKHGIVGKNLWEVYVDAVNTDSYYYYNKAIQENTPQHFETFYEVLNKWFEVSAYPSFNGISVYFKDITERKQTTEKIRQSNERFEMVGKATNDAIWDWNLITGEVARTGDGLKSLFGYEPEEANTDKYFWSKRLHPDDLIRIKESRRHVFNETSDSYWEDKYRFKRADDQYAYVYDRGYIIRNEEGKAIRMIGATQDISKLKENEMQLKVLNEELEARAKELAISNHELEQFAYVASHDLQEPLRMVTSFLSQIDKKYGSIIDAKGKQYIHFAVDGAKRMRQIILDLLEYSRVGRTEDTMEEVDLKSLLKDIISLHRKQIEETHARIEMKNLPTLKIYRTPLQQIFQNLLSNALKYRNKGKSPIIKISAQETPTHWQFTVKDNGIGINADYFDKIFIIFQRLHTKHEFSGTGLGLAIVKKIVENLGGQIWIESQEGHGSTFFFTIKKEVFV